MKSSVLLFVILFGLVAHGATFDCLGTEPKGDASYQVSGEILNLNVIANVKIEISDKDSAEKHVAVQNKEQITSDESFQPKSSKLKNYGKFVIEKKMGDEFILFLPKAFISNSFDAYIKLKFDGTYPDLELLKCHY